jgi:Mn2+/Fe2+ NRAMP family transporter
MGRTLEIGFSERFGSEDFKRILIVIIAFGSLMLILFFEQLGGFGLLVNTATAISFLIAPLIAILNLRLVSKNSIGSEFAPGIFMRWLSYLGILFLTLFSGWFLYSIVTM